MFEKKAKLSLILKMIERKSSSTTRATARTGLSRVPKYLPRCAYDLTRAKCQMPNAKRQNAKSREREFNRALTKDIKYKVIVSLTTYGKSERDIFKHYASAVRATNERQTRESQSPIPPAQ